MVYRTCFPPECMLDDLAAPSSRPKNSLLSLMRTTRCIYDEIKPLLERLAQTRLFNLVLSNKGVCFENRQLFVDFLTPHGLQKMTSETIPPLGVFARTLPRVCNLRLAIQIDPVTAPDGLVPALEPCAMWIFSLICRAEALRNLVVDFHLSHSFPADTIAIKDGSEMSIGRLMYTLLGAKTAAHCQTVLKQALTSELQVVRFVVQQKASDAQAEKLIRSWRWCRPSRADQAIPAHAAAAFPPPVPTRTQTPPAMQSVDPRSSPDYSPPPPATSVDNSSREPPERLWEPVQAEASPEYSTPPPSRPDTTIPAKPLSPIVTSDETVSADFIAFKETSNHSERSIEEPDTGDVNITTTKLNATAFGKTPSSSPDPLIQKKKNRAKINMITIDSDSDSDILTQSTQTVQSSGISPKTTNKERERQQKFGREDASQPFNPRSQIEISPESSVTASTAYQPQPNLATGHSTNNVNGFTTTSDTMANAYGSVSKKPRRNMPPRTLPVVRNGVEEPDMEIDEVTNPNLRIKLKKMHALFPKEAVRLCYEALLRMKGHYNDACEYLVAEKSSQGSAEPLINEDEDREEDDEYVVERLIRVKNFKGVQRILVKWKGYDETTWEPRAQLLEDVPEMVRAFDEAMGLERRREAERAIFSAGLQQFSYHGVIGLPGPGPRDATPNVEGATFASPRKAKDKDHRGSLKAPEQSKRTPGSVASIKNPPRSSSQAPKRPSSAYLLYMKAHRPTIAADLCRTLGSPSLVQDARVSNEGTRRWLALEPSERARWERLHALRVAVYHVQMDAYKAGRAVPTPEEARRLRGLAQPQSTAFMDLT